MPSVYDHEESATNMTSTSSRNSSRGRPTRTLCSDADSARRNIMRLPDAPPNSPIINARQAPSLAHTNDGGPGVNGHGRHQPNQAQRVSSLLEGVQADQQSERPDISRRTSSSYPSSYPHSTFSDPFDLHVTDSEDERPSNVNHIDAIMAGSRRSTQSRNSHRAGPNGLLPVQGQDHDESNAHDASGERDGDGGGAAEARAYVSALDRPFPLRLMRTLTNLILSQRRKHTRPRASRSGDGG